MFIIYLQDMPALLLWYQHAKSFGALKAMTTYSWTSHKAGHTINWCNIAAAWANLYPSLSIHK